MASARSILALPGLFDSNVLYVPMTVARLDGHA